jgi:hypothetical protein
MSRPEVASLVAAMLQARDAVERRSLSYPQAPTTEEWWADVLADPRAQAKAAHDLAVKQAFYRLADERRETILVACSKCDWWAAFPGTTSSLLMVRTTRCPTYSTISPHRVALPRQHVDRQRSPSLRSQRGSGMRRQRRRSRSTPTCSSRTTAARRPRSMPRSEGKP